MKILKNWLYQIVTCIAWFHDRIVAQSTGFSSEELHFIVLGVFGLCLLLLAYPIFRYLTRRGCAGIMTWLFAFSAVLSVCFAIEIGQHLTKTGTMQLEDIVYGMIGFFAASVCFALLYLLVRFIKHLFQKK
jgi:TRAP-type uncharacterized transport system fused permease subunit